MATVALSYQEIETHPERVSKITPFIKKYNWNGLKYPWKFEDWKRFEKNNSEKALNILHAKDTETLLAYISSHNSTREKQIILLIISSEESEKEGWHYLAVELSALLCKKTSNDCSDFYCLNFLHFFRTANKLKSHGKACKDKDLSHRNAIRKY